MDNIIETIPYKDYIIRIYPELDPLNPRDYLDTCLGTMICFHRRYNLGDKTKLKVTDFDGWGELEQHLIKKNKAIVILPLYLLDHSNIAMSTNDYNDRWDSGQVGFIYTTKKAISNWYGLKKLDVNTIDKARNVLIQEVDDYSTYISGYVYYYTIARSDNDAKMDSCGNYFGIDAAIAEAKSIIDTYPNQIYFDFYQQLTSENSEYA